MARAKIIENSKERIVIELTGLEPASKSSCDCGRKQHSLHWGCYANLMKPDTKAQDWEKELANMIYDYNRNTDGLLFIEAKFHNKLEDFISNAIHEAYNEGYRRGLRTPEEHE